MQQPLTPQPPAPKAKAQPKAVHQMDITPTFAGPLQQPQQQPVPQQAQQQQEGQLPQQQPQQQQPQQQPHQQQPQQQPQQTQPQQQPQRQQEEQPQQGPEEQPQQRPEQPQQRPEEQPAQQQQEEQPAQQQQQHQLLQAAKARPGKAPPVNLLPLPLPAPPTQTQNPTPLPGPSTAQTPNLAAQTGGRRTPRIGLAEEERICEERWIPQTPDWNLRRAVPVLTSLSESDLGALYRFGADARAVQRLVQVSHSMPGLVPHIMMKVRSQMVPSPAQKKYRIVNAPLNCPYAMSFRLCAVPFAFQLLSASSLRQERFTGSPNPSCWLMQVIKKDHRGVGGQIHGALSLVVSCGLGAAVAAQACIRHIIEY